MYPMKLKVIFTLYDFIRRTLQSRTIEFCDQLINDGKVLVNVSWQETNQKYFNDNLVDEIINNGFEQVGQSVKRNSLLPIANIYFSLNLTDEKIFGEKFSIFFKK